MSETRADADVDGIAIVAHDGAHHALDAFPDALALAAESIDSGAAARTLDAWVFSPGS